MKVLAEWTQRQPEELAKQAEREKQTVKVAVADQRVADYTAAVAAKHAMECAV